MLLRYLSQSTHFSLFLLICLLIFTQSSYAIEIEASCHSNTPGQMTNRFTDLNDGTVLDIQTKLIWQRCNLGQIWDTESQTCQNFTDTLTWHDTFSAIREFNQSLYSSGHADDWRMPNIKELASIIDISCSGITINTDFFFSVQLKYWSSTPSAAGVSTKKIMVNDELESYQDENLIWTINVTNGTEQTEAISLKRSTRLVRGPSEP